MAARITSTARGSLKWPGRGGGYRAERRPSLSKPAPAPERPSRISFPRFSPASASSSPPAQRTSRSRSSTKTFLFCRSISSPLRVCYMKGRGNFACRQKIYDAERSPCSPAWKRSPISRSSANGRKPRKPGIGRKSRRCRKTAPSGPKSTRGATVHRTEVPAVRTLLPHPDASASRRERHHHRQSPPLLRRPGSEG